MGCKGNHIFIKENRKLVIFLAAAGVLMLLYDILGVDHFIGYIDGEAYYSYLPEYFLQGNWSYFVKYPIGTALLELPFFLAAHVITLMINPAQANGYTQVYDWAVGISGIFYFVLGMVVLYQVLKKLFSEKQALWSCVLMTFGTSLPLYATKYASFSHIKTFAVTAVMIWIVLRMEEGADDVFHNFALGIIAGLLVILRNINVFLLLFYLLWGFGRWQTWKEHLKKVFSVRRLLPNVLGGLLVVVPQMILWKISTGHFICYSYEGEGFTYLTNPKIWEVLFSDAKGLLIFCPVLLFSLLGMFCMKKGQAANCRAGVVGIFLVELYTTAAWWCWWLGIYGARSFVDIFCFLGISMAAFWSWLEDCLQDETKKRQRAAKVFYIAAAVLCCLINLAFLRGMQQGVINEAFAFWGELQEALGR